MSRPNVILYNWHDAGAWFGCYDNKEVNTPHVDRLAAEGVRFANNRSACAICSPSRAAIATGKFCQNNGVMGLCNNTMQNRIHPHLPHMAARFKQMGYRSALFGIQHECAHEHVAEILRVDEQFATDPWANSDIVKHYLKNWIIERKDNDEPFFAQVGSYDAHLNRFYSGAPARDNEPYPPLQDTTKGLHMPAYLTGSDADKETVATLQGLLQRGDRMVGAVLETLDETGMADNTLIIMNVDHGVGLSRAKGTCYDPGTTTAWIMRWPDKIQAGTVVSQLSTHVDVLPTVWELLGLDPIDNLDGFSFAQHVTDNRQDELHDYVYSHMVENTRSIRNHSWKLIRNFRPQSWANRKGDCASQHKLYEFNHPDVPDAKKPCREFPSVELYDLENDPDELVNLSFHEQHADKCKTMDAALWNFLLDNNDFLVRDTVNSEWQLATRQDLEAHCLSHNRPCPHGEGTFINKIDAAAAQGQVLV